MKTIPLLLILVIISGCAYYNTMFNAEDRYAQAEKKLASSPEQKVTNDIKNDYQAVIDKCWKLINVHGDDSRYADDALLLIGKSHFQREEYVKAERFLDQFTRKYPESDLLMEGFLWLGRAQIKQGREDDARVNLNKIIADNRNDEFMAIAWYSLAELEYKNGLDENAIRNYQEAVRYTDDDLLAARSLFAVGSINFELENYDPAIDNFEEALGYDVSDEFAFEIQMKKVDAMLKMNDPEAAEGVLYNMQRNSRYLDKAASVDARLGDAFAKDEDYDNAIEQYLYVLETYPRTPGSANAAYGLAQITEYYFADIDSAKSLYDRVKQENRNSENVIAADIRSGLLAQYIKIRDDIVKDRTELAQVRNPEEDQTEEPEVEEQQTDDANTSNKSAAKLRTEDEIIKSLHKNKFSLAEFFLLTMQNYDSALTAYSYFTDTVIDSAYTPKALYSQAYIYRFHYQDSVAANQLYDRILIEYGNSEYAFFILEQRGRLVKQAETQEEDEYKEVFLQAEDYMYAENYDDALTAFEIIAEDDSGSIWAEKSRYAIAWIYEKKLDDTDAAVLAYQNIVSEYPNTEYAKIAQNKIKPPPEEVVTIADDSLAVSDTLSSQVTEVVADSAVVDTIVTELTPDENIEQKLQNKSFLREEADGEKATSKSDSLQNR